MIPGIQLDHPTVSIRPPTESLTNAFPPTIPTGAIPVLNSQVGCRRSAGPMFRSGNL